MASPLTFTQLNQLYLAYFGRPVDYNGYLFYTTNNATVSDVAAAFASSQESQNLYGTGSVASQVNAIYQNLFNRAAEPAGLTYWTQQIMSGAISAPQAAIQILGGAQGTDSTCIANKLTASSTFFNDIDTTAEILGYAGTAAAASARAWLATVTSDVATLPSATAAATALANAVAAGTATAGQVLNFTTAVDTLVGGSGNDTFNGQLSPTASLNTFGALDSVDGGAGANTLNIIDTNTGGSSTIPAGVTVKNIQTINVNSAQSVGDATPTVFDVSSQAGLTALNVTSIGADNIKAASTTDVTVNDTTTAGGLTAAVSGGNNVTITTIGGSNATTVTADGTNASLTINQATGGAVTVGGTTAVKGAVTIADTNFQGAAIAVDGGTNVSVTASTKTTFAGASGAITIGAVTKPTGTVAVVENLNGTGATTGGTITVKGGTVDNITVNATQATAGATTTVGTVTVNGSAVTTSVAVTETAAVAPVAAVTAVAGVTESGSAVFPALTAGQTLIVGGLTFTAGAAGTTAAQTAAAFANLTKGALQGNSALGTYSGSLTGWTSGAVSGTSTVVFTSTTANTNVADLAFTGTGTAPTITETQGSAATAAVTGVAGIVDGSVNITDAKAGTGAGTLNYVQLSGFGTSTIASDALATLSLANSAAGVTVTDVGGATALALTVNNLGAASTLNLDGGGNVTYKTLNITTAGADSTDNITAAGVTALTVAGTNAIDLTGSTLTALKTVTVSGSAGVTLASGANVTDINASATSGNMTVTNFDATKATYEGGSGNDALTLSTVNPTKAISLGAGNDTLTLAAGTTAPTATLDGGAGTDTLSMAAADAATASGSTAFATKVINFEHLTLTGATTSTVALDVLGGYNYVTDGGATALTLNNMASGGTIVQTTVGANDTVNITNAATGTADVLNVVLSSKGPAAVTGTTVTAANVETINIAANDTNTKDAAGTITHSTTLVDTAATSITITGNANLSLTSTGNTSVGTVDASAMTGGLTYTTAGTVAEVVKGGAAANSLTALGGTVADTLIGGAGNDTITANAGMDTLTGNGGNDKFVIQTPSANLNSYATITDANAGDTVQLSTTGTITFVQSKVTLGSTAVFQDYANAIVHSVATNQGNIAWFQYGGDTYIVQHESAVVAETSFTNGTDLVVKLAGLIDLSHTSLNTGTATLLIG